MASSSPASTSSFAPPATRLSSDLSLFLDSLEANQDASKSVHMRKGREQLDTFLESQHGHASTFEQVVAKDSELWQQHVQKANEDKDVRVQQRHALPELLPGLETMHDIKVGRPGRPDDAIYQKSQYAREWLPRGNCIAKWSSEDQQTYYFPLIRGYRKFTGQEDDGELKKHSGSEEEELSKFFTKPQASSKWVISTTKENGEAGHLAILKRSDGQFVFVLGSKNTHLMAQTIEDVERARQEQRSNGNDPFLAAAPIAIAILRMLFALESDKRNLLCEFLWQTRATASFEVLCPSHQHVQLLDYLSEDTPVFYGLSLMGYHALEGTEICVNPVLLYEFMGALGVRTVTYDVSEFNPAEFEAALERSKSAYQHEGGVHLFLDEDAAVIGMQKHKSVWYVCLRAIREKTKTFCRSLNSKKAPKGRAKALSPSEALDTAKKSVFKRFQAIPAFLQISDEVCNAYEALGERFLEYLFEEKLFRGVASSKQHEEEGKQVAKDVADLFPVVWRTFLDRTGVSDVIEQQ
ncbi:hypothetical protein PHYBOEH_006570 [Phytophthora boehmeriae]|uniref:DUF7920 domain-containing protein n=1 Tax=Phytophthora boehmeriae TaxID=109152 RepID=A0A8T1X1W8_9STRA|nr:hypothetical protein PHYBOEH_006570 [Phytophthora boehmeriae]